MTKETELGTAEQVFTFDELWESMCDSNVFHIYPCGYYTGETSEDPIECFYNAGDAFDWIIENPAYSEYGESIGYLVISMTEDDGHMVLF